MEARMSRANTTPAYCTASAICCSCQHGQLKGTTTSPTCCQSDWHKFLGQQHARSLSSNQLGLLHLPEAAIQHCSPAERQQDAAELAAPAACKQQQRVQLQNIPTALCLARPLRAVADSEDDASLA